MSADPRSIMNGDKISADLNTPQLHKITCTPRATSKKSIRWEFKILFQGLEISHWMFI